MRTRFHDFRIRWIYCCGYGRRALLFWTLLVVLVNVFGASLAEAASLMARGDANGLHRPWEEVARDAVIRTFRKHRDEKDSWLALSSNGSNTFHSRRSRRQRVDDNEYNPMTILASRVKMWPPWPLNLLQGGDDEDEDEDEDGDKSSREENDEKKRFRRKKSPKSEVVTASNAYPSAAAIAFAWCTQRARIGVRQLQEAGSALWFHLPPTLPPLLLIASLPQRTNTGTRIIPLLQDPFARNVALAGLGVAVLSWAHQELHRKRNLTPLGLPQSVSRVFLPPFLPELVSEPEIEALQQSQKNSDKRQILNHTHEKGGNMDEREQQQDETAHDDDDESSQVLSMLRPGFRKHLNDIYENSPLKKKVRRQSIWNQWKQKRAVRKREAAKIRRLTIFDELVSLQAIKRRSKARRLEESSKLSTKGNEEEESLGYALVTGASQGIGRALAVELARWEIPLVLVARDIDRLISLAYDLEACYGVRCCVLKADLSEMDAAERIHETTNKAGLNVDILINNAGIAFEGLSTEMDISDMEKMIMINTMSFAKLAKLYGQSMMQRRQGRILMVSSMAGMTSSSPNTALYGATKAFERSLSLSMSKELEPYGVGVTCLMPGPVSNTQFQARSGTARALCWHIPFYPRPAESVAHLGVASLLDGDTQVIPGWQNRVFVQLFRPILPQRVESMCVQTAWSPLRLPKLGSMFGKRKLPTSNAEPSSAGLINKPPPDSVHLNLNPRYNFQIPPRLLYLPAKELEVEVEIKPKPSTEFDDDQDAADSLKTPASSEAVSESNTNESGTTPEGKEKQLQFNRSTTSEIDPPGKNTHETPTPPPKIETPQKSAVKEEHTTVQPHAQATDVEDAPVEEELPASRTPSAAHSPEKMSPLEKRNDMQDYTHADKYGEGKSPTPGAIGMGYYNSQGDDDEDGEDEIVDEDDDDDFPLTPRLGPVDLLQRDRLYPLPTTNPTKPR